MRLASGKELTTETVLYAVGRQGDTEALALENAGLEPDARGRLAAGPDHRTAVEHIFAVGDVAGGGLAATAMEQGRIAALHAFGEPVHELPELVPTGVYAIPEIGMVGRTEEELTDAGGALRGRIARWHELARGLMSGDEDGMLKLLVSTEDRRLLGVHVIGTGATDLVHIGQAMMGGDATIDFLVDRRVQLPDVRRVLQGGGADAANRIRAMT